MTAPLDDTIESIDSTDRSAMEAEFSILMSAVNQDDDVSNLTQITLQLREAAKDRRRRDKSIKAVHAAVPLEVKEALLQSEFPHVRDNNDNKTERVGDDADSIKAVLDERSGGVSIDYNDCIETLSEPETQRLRRSMENKMKQNVMETMGQLSDQMSSYHAMLDENELLRKEMAQMKKKKDELEKSFIDMKLQVARLQGQEDYHKLHMAKLEMDLKKARDENQKLHEQLGIHEKQNNSTGRNRPRLSKSLSSVTKPIDKKAPTSEQKKNPLLNRSWFGETLSGLQAERQKGLTASFLGRFGSSSPKIPEEDSTSPPFCASWTAGQRGNSSFTKQKTQGQPTKESDEFLPWDRMRRMHRSQEYESKLAKSTSSEEREMARYNPSIICSSGVFDGTMLGDSGNDVSSSSGEEDDSSSIAIEFEPARPQLQKELSLKKVVPQHLQEKAMKMRGDENGQQLQRAASLRGRNKGKESSAGDVYLAFC